MSDWARLDIADCIMVCVIVEVKCSSFKQAIDVFKSFIATRKHAPQSEIFWHKFCCFGNLAW